MRQNAVAAAVLIAIVCVGYYWTTQFAEVPRALSQNVPPTFFPRLVLGAIALAAVALVLFAPRSPAARAPIPKEVLVTASLLVITVWLMPRVGMLATTSLFAILVPAYWGERRPKVLAALATALPLGIYLIFVLGLGMRLPRGLLW